MDKPNSVTRLQQRTKGPASLDSLLPLKVSRRPTPRPYIHPGLDAPKEKVPSYIPPAHIIDQEQPHTPVQIPVEEPIPDQPYS